MKYVFNYFVKNNVITKSCIKKRLKTRLLFISKYYKLLFELKYALCNNINNYILFDV